MKFGLLVALIILTSQKSYVFTWKLPVHKFGQRIFPAAETSKIIFGTRWLKHRTKGRHSLYGSDSFYVYCRTKVRWKSLNFSCRENPGDFSVLYGYLPCKGTPAFTVWCLISKKLEDVRCMLHGFYASVAVQLKTNTSYNDRAKRVLKVFNCEL